MTSLTLKPNLIRADTIDLQPQHNPSAKDHTRGQHGGYSHASQSSTAPHHAQALRSANQDAFQERHTSPRLGGFDHDHINPQGQNHMYDDGDEDDDDDHMHNGTNGHNHHHHHHHDGYDDGEGHNSEDEDMDDELLDKISSSPSIEDEDIDFEFVYALHTFVAIVEGQANATKGDTMVLLDDSNSYWWLVRVVKDGSIGYLPAEHIETPTERLARLNKHRNIDLSAAMLGDNPERTRNPLTRAIRRRNAKTVNFAPPTYYEPEEREWSDEEEEDHEGEDEPDGHGQNNAEEERQAQQSQQSQQVQQIHQPTDQQKAQPAAATIHRVGDNDDIDEDDEEPSSPIKPEASTPATLQTTSQDAVQRSRKGVVRNTDSFFRDDTVETKKISLTPRLLRGDGDSSAPAEQEVKQRASLDTFDRITADEKSKDGKRKEKKGMLSGLFKRKDKSGKASKSDTEDADRASEDSGRSPQSKDSVEGDVTPERKPGKLQKTPPSVVSPKQSPTETRAPQRDLASVTAQHQSLSASLDPSPAAPRSQTGTSHETEQSGNLGMTHQTPGRFPSLNEKRSVFAPITGALRSKNASQDMDDSTLKPIYSKRAKERFAIDDSDSEDDSTPTAHSSILHRSISPLDANDRNVGRPGSEQRVSPPDMQDRQSPPGLMQAPVPTEARPEAVRPTAAEMTPTSPSEQTASTSKHSPSVATHTPSTSRSTPTWSDASLRSYMDNDQDVRDLLVIVHDKTNVQPVGPDHPLMNGLFMSEKVKLADMQTQLDSMLMTWLAKKNRPGTTRA